MNVGDYVRTKSYGITKILNTYNNTTTNYSSITLDKIDSFGRLGVSVGNNDIIKSSPNIIDLIEAGDYVNGRKIEELYCCAEYEGLGFDESDDSGRNYILLNEIDIKSVVTHEQFESMEYKVGEE